MNRLEKLKEAKSIIDQYAQKCSTIDEGNLYFAATQFEFASAEYEKIIAELEKALVVARGAMAYAYEDYADRFYLNVKEDITVALQKLKEFKG